MYHFTVRRVKSKFGRWSVSNARRGEAPSILSKKHIPREQNYYMVLGSCYYMGVWHRKTRMSWLPDGEKFRRYLYSFWCTSQTWQTDGQTDGHRTAKTEWAKLYHAVIAASVQWRRRFSVCVKAGGGHFEHCFWFRYFVFGNNYDLSCCRVAWGGHTPLPLLAAWLAAWLNPDWIGQ